MNEYMKERWRKRRVEAELFLGGKCVICGVSEDLEFDHINPATKLYTIAKASSFSEKRFWEEVKKCQLLCKEHHYEKSRINKDYRGGHNKILDPQHGTSIMYNREKCKCDLCKDWKRKSRK